MVSRRRTVTLRTPAEKPPDVAAALVCCGVDHVWVGGVELEIGDPGALVDLEYGRPRDAAVLGAEDATITAGGHAERFAAGDLKPAAFTREDVERRAARRYRAGCEAPPTGACADR